MSDTSSAEKTAIEHLRIIRTLMERAHIYRAVSAPAALIGGVLALAVSSLGYYYKDSDIPPTQFLFAWLLLLALCTVLNLFLLIRESKDRNQPFLTDGLRMALRAVIPPLTAGGFLGICLIVFKGELTLAALIWILCYGLALLSTASFAPKSVTRLGGCFLLSGMGLALTWFINGSDFGGQNTLSLASVFLGLTFGAGHIVYSLAVFFNTPKACL